LKNGPGLVFSEFLLWSHGHTLSVTSYHFNSALNPKLDPEKARWAGVIVNANYRFFLSKRFKDSKWYPISPVSYDQGGMVVGIIPIDRKNREVFKRWVRALQYFYVLGIQAENIHNHKELYRAALEHLPDGYPLMQGDPFLESCFGEWMAQYHWDGHYKMNTLIIQKTLARGYPCALLYYKLGNFLYLDARPKEARAAFEMAMRCKPNYTDALGSIRTIDEESRQK
jgi:hypothetical protein